MVIQTGKQPVTLLTAASILSLSLVVNLPGLAISPMLGTLQQVFPHTTETEQQLLTVLPNLLIIPFVLLSGRLSLSRHKISTVVSGLAIFLICGILYFFANDMLSLIILSCALGCGAGLIIPFSTGFIADVFTDRYQMKVMGLQSGISNLTVVVATFVVGWLCGDVAHWHLPFIVYLVAFVPLIMTIFLRGIPASDFQINQLNAAYNQSGLTQYSSMPASSAISASNEPRTYKGFYIGRLIGIIGVYFFITFATMVIDYYVSYLCEAKGWKTSLGGTITALFFLFIFLSGFLLPYIVRFLKATTFWVCSILICIGLGLLAFFQHIELLCIGTILAGTGYGILQPLIYDKASRTILIPEKATLALAFVLSSNYLSIVAVPFIIDIARSIFHNSDPRVLPFIFNFFLSCGFAAVAFAMRKQFAFSVKNDYYQKNTTNNPHKKTADKTAKAV